MKKFLQEFKEFAMRGNVIDMAVGVVIGAAFKAIVDSFVNDLLSPIIGLLTGQNFSDLSIKLFNDKVTICYGSFITAVINFILVAFFLFLFVKGINTLRDRVNPPKPQAPKTKVCPYCKSEIPVDATRCPHCTSELPKDKA